MKQAVLKKINTVNTACKTGVPPEKNEDKCTYCRYKNECALVDAGKWVHPNPPVKPKTAKKSPKKSSTGKSKGTKKTGQKSPKTASTDADILSEALNLDDLQESCGCM